MIAQENLMFAVFTNEGVSLTHGKRFGQYTVHAALNNPNAWMVTHALSGCSVIPEGYTFAKRDQAVTFAKMLVKHKVNCDAYWLGRQRKDFWRRLDKAIKETYSICGVYIGKPKERG